MRASAQLPPHVGASAGRRGFRRKAENVRIIGEFLSYLLTCVGVRDFAAPQRKQRPFVGGWSAEVTPVPSCWADLEVMDDIPDFGLFMGSNVFLLLGIPRVWVNIRIPPIGWRSEAIWHYSAPPPDRTTEFGYLRKNQGERDSLS